MRARAVVVFVTVLSLVLGSVGNAAAVGGPPADPKTTDAALPDHAAGVLLVGFSPAASANDRAAARASVRALGASPLSPLAPDAEKWQLPVDANLTNAIAALGRNPNVRYAEPDWKVATLDTSNDPYYTNGSLWGMHGDGITPYANQYGTGADEAWAQGVVGSPDVYVGVIDEGAQFDHPDLAANFWTNPYEIAGNGLDDDGNGYADDIHGWDFFTDDSSTYDGTGDDHGTHVSGTIGGVGANGLGVAGVNWDVTLISGKFLGPSGGNTSDAVNAVDYMTDLKTRHGLNIVATSNSWGGGGFSQSLLDAINRGGNAGILFIAAAGNSSLNTDSGGYYPQGYQCTNGGTRGWDCVVSVAAIDSAGNLASFSNYGATTVDLGAPGVGVQSTLPTDTYGSYSGTSMATPHVSGAAALCASVNPGLTARDLRQALVGTTRSTASLAGKTVSGGRLDVGSMIASGACGFSTVAPSGSVTNLAATATGTATVSLAWTDTISDETFYEIERAPGSVGSCGTFTSAGATGPNATAFVVGGLSASTSYCFRVRGANSYTEGTNRTAWSNLASATTLAPPPAYVCSTVGYAWIDPTGGTNYTLSDDAAVSVTLPFSVTSYGTTYTTATISSNGFLRLGSGAATAYTNTAIPNTGDPNAFFAPAWDDWNPGAGGTISVKTIGTSPSRRYVVTWSNIPHFSVAGSAVSFQAILEQGTDAVTFQYLDMSTGSATYDRGASATAGVESATGEWGTQLSSNAPNLTDGLAKRCSSAAGIPPSVSVTASYPDATIGVAYATGGASASGGVGPYTWSLGSGSLPAGLSVEASTGTVAGTPTASGTYAFALRATGLDGGTALSESRTIRSSAALTIGTTSLPNGATGTAYSQQLVSTGGIAPITWTVSAGSLPGGLTLSAGGLISGVPATDGTATFTVTASDGALPSARVASQALSITTVLPLVLPSGTFPEATTNTDYSFQMTAGNATGAVTWAVTAGALPTGVTLGTSTGLLSGKPTTAGLYSFTITATSSGAMGTSAGSIRVVDPVAIAQTALPAGTAGAAYSTTLTASGGSGTVTWSATGLPANLSLSAGGVLSGTPAQSGTFTVSVSASDTAGRTDTHLLSLTLAFARQAPANGTRYARGKGTVTISWYEHKNATYEYCLTKSSKGCATWTAAPNGTLAVTQAVGNGETWYWNVRAILGGSTFTAAGGLWKFSIAK